MQRYREIVTAFSRNGFGFFVRELGLDTILSLPKRLIIRDKAENVHTKTRGERVRLFLEELGPTFVKLGQVASTRPDLLPEDIIKELQKLQDDVPPFPYEEGKPIIERELGADVDEIFAVFEETPLAAASIGQVHYGVLKSGEKVAVKIQRPDIEERIKTDLEILLQLALMAELRIEWAAHYQVREMVEEFSRAILDELDYTKEGRNADKMARQFYDTPAIRIPDIYWDLSTKKVLTMEFVEGTKLNNVDRLRDMGFDTKQLGERLTNAVLHQVLIEGFFHGDLHPGNISVQSGEVIIFMDFGLAGRITADMKDNFASLVIAMMRQNTDGVIRAITRMGLVPDDVDMNVLRADVDELREKYYDVSLSQISLGDAVNDLFDVANRHRIKLPSDLTLLGKTLLTLEGIVEKLDPEISIIKIAEPFGKQLLKERYHPKTVAENMFNQWSEFRDILVDAPGSFRELSSMIKKGKIPLELSMPRLEQFLNKLDRVSNRLSFSIVLLAFSIIMVGLIVGSAISGESSLVWDIPAVEIGFVVASLMFLWLLYSIFKSGRF
ncbi:AarF/ABC1/UbiB kinase family protein [Virgibacillus sp. MSP4-1]|uniref:ABC1 kinase family protein n=1 Tax=Virgibacillus sp. MSP4-1 TaxID=2700081 RepID=UPI0003A8909F|nr:AarF/ABC1/UbiB kinase family protein [Virgibacillus sp. MSP4-1]QHS21443.1 AarF/ABC1/UbiB kinase family protein [Virgibacillus sp. MSP4-1]